MFRADQLPIPEILRQIDPIPSKMLIYNRFSLAAALPSEKSSIITNRKSATNFPMS